MRRLHRRTLALLALLVLLALPLRVHAGPVRTVLRVAVAAHLPPFQFEKDGVITGMHVELLQEIAERNNMELELVDYETPQACEKALEKGEADLILGVIKPELVQQRRYTDSINSSTICAVAAAAPASALQQLQQRGAAGAIFELGTIGYAFMAGIGTMQYQAVSDQERVFRGLLSGREQIAFCVKDSVLYQLEQAGKENDYVIIKNHMRSVDYCMQVADGDKNLQETLNSAIVQLRVDGTYDAISQRWLVQSDAQARRLQRVLRAVLLAAGAALAGTLIVIAVNFRWNRALKRLVDQRTQELQRANVHLERQIQQTKQENLLRYRIVENNPCGYISFDRRGMVTTCNGSALRLLGLTEVPEGVDVLQLELPAMILADKLHEILGQGRQYLNETLHCGKPVERQRTYHYSVYQVYESGSINGAILALEDTTEHDRMIQMQFEREKLRVLNQTVSGIAHEIRNPLMSIKMYAQLLQKQADNQLYWDNFSKVVPQEVDRINSLITNLIDYARPAKGVRETVCLREEVDAALCMVAPLIKKARIAYVCRGIPAVKLQMERGRLRQILTNIFLNAVQSMQQKLAGEPDGTRTLQLTVRGWTQDGDAFLEIRDEGTGMSREVLSRATEPFFTTKGQGTGMGLALTKQFLQENHGELFMESEEGVYTSMILKFGGEICCIESS